MALNNKGVVPTVSQTSYDERIGIEYSFDMSSVFPGGFTGFQIQFLAANTSAGKQALARWRHKYRSDWNGWNEI